MANDSLPNPSSATHDQAVQEQREQLRLAAAQVRAARGDGREQRVGAAVACSAAEPAAVAASAAEPAAEPDAHERRTQVRVAVLAKGVQVRAQRALEEEGVLRDYAHRLAQRCKR